MKSFRSKRQQLYSRLAIHHYSAIVFIPGFGTGTGTSLFGAKTTGTTFGGFGTPTQSGTGLFGNTGTTGIFGSTPSAFGTATNTQSTSMVFLVRTLGFL